MHKLTIISGIFILVISIFSIYEVFLRSPESPCSSNFINSSSLIKKKLVNLISDDGLLFCKEQINDLTKILDHTSDIYDTCCAWNGTKRFDNNDFSTCKKGAHNFLSALGLVVEHTNNALLAEEVNDDRSHHLELNSAKKRLMEGLNSYVLLKNGMDLFVKQKTEDFELSFVALKDTIMNGGCSGEGPDIPPSPASFITGGAGDIAFASVSLYAVDISYQALYDHQNPIAVATTNSYAEVSGLPVPNDIPPPYVLTIDAANAIDINTGKSPVFTKLVSIVTKDSLKSNRPIFATPYSTLAYYYLKSEPSKSLDTLSLTEISRKLIQYVGFGISNDINIFSTHPIITGNTVTVEDQQKVVDFRSANEALTAIINKLANSNEISADQMLQALAGHLNDEQPNQTVDVDSTVKFEVDILSLDPMHLIIPGTQYTVRKILLLMEEENNLLGHSDIVFVKGRLEVRLRPIDIQALSNDQT